MSFECPVVEETPAQSGTEATLQKLLAEQYIRPLDLAFAELIGQHAPPAVAMLAACLSKATGEQHSCLLVSELVTQQPFAQIYHFPPLAELQSQLRQSQCVSDIREESSPDTRPLVLAGDAIYLQRYWVYEQQIAAKIQKMTGQARPFNHQACRTLLAELFPERQAGIDWQKVAVAVAARQPLTLITGGPGTGKTTTVSKLLALLTALSEQSLHIALVAPTGKAAARLGESLADARARLPAHLQGQMPSSASTIHRLLGAKANSVYFKANANRPLQLDLLIVDEASMIDLPLMAKLFSALGSRTRVVLLGDQDQLASVEVGSVLADMCSAAGAQPGKASAFSPAMTTYLQQQGALPETTAASSSPLPLQDHLVQLQVSHRFSADSGIGKLAKAVNRAQQGEIQPLLHAPDLSDIDWRAQFSPLQLVRAMLDDYRTYFANVASGQLDGIFAAWQHQQILCALRKGNWGVQRLNVLVEAELVRVGLVKNSQEFYPGKPIMLTTNDHQLGLYNGDIGIVMPDPRQPDLNKVWFLNSKGQYQGILTSRLPDFEVCYAMTIHKSQGSEFSEVHLCLGDTLAQHVNRELLYTGITRAKQQLFLYAPAGVIKQSIQQRCKRSTGLAERLMKGEA